jgi:VIT1/CCC1 family predicted Fe2+/Mn2+ transporter
LAQPFPAAAYTDLVTTKPPPERAADIKRYRGNLRDEVDGAALYRLLAKAEKNPHLRTVYERLALSEERHLALWETKLREAGAEVPVFRPSFRIKLIGWLARRLGTTAVSPIVARMEIAATGMYDNQPEAVEANLPADERSHARLFREISGAGPSSVDIARIEGRHRGANGNALRAAVLGANDGLVSNLSLVMGVAGADPGRDFVVLSGIAGLLAGSLSMALGEWISVRSSSEALDRQLAIEKEELAAMPEEEEAELTLIYQAKGLSEADARATARRIIADPEIALATLAREELGMGGEEDGSAWVAAITSFLTFSIGAVLPVLPWLVFSGTAGIAASAVASGVGLFLTGAIITLYTGRSVLFSGARMLGFGLAAAAITFAIGRLIGVNTAG